jgi:hypothetical protein
MQASKLTHESVELACIELDLVAGGKTQRMMTYSLFSSHKLWINSKGIDHIFNISLLGCYATCREPGTSNDQVEFSPWFLSLSTLQLVGDISGESTSPLASPSCSHFRFLRALSTRRLLQYSVK